MPMIQLNTHDLPMGAPLPWPVFNRDGSLLLSKGTVLDSEIQRSALLRGGLFREDRQDPLDDDELSAFDGLEVIKTRLWSILDDIRQDRAADVDNRVRKLAGSIQSLSSRHADTLLGALLLDTHSRYTLLHPLLCSVLSELVGTRCGLSAPNRALLLCAALTQNLGMLQIQEELSNQEEPLSEQQRAAVHAHPEKGVRILERAGVTDKAWLSTVLLHHEKPDGSGYPRGLRAGDIPLPSRILSLADIYSAMVLPRRYRDGIHVRKALREIFLYRGKLVDERLAHVFIKEMGVYPPGCFVELSSGEIGLVTRRSLTAADKPVVNTLFGPEGDYYQPPLVRDTARSPIHAIKRIIPRPDRLQGSPEQFWNV